jgi:hypothetical protein
MHLQLLQAIQAAAQPVDTTPPGVVGHDVQFYRTDAYLTHTVADFLARGVRAGQPLVVIATSSHRAAIVAELRRLGINVDELFSNCDALWLDARDTLAAFMHGPRPDRELFIATLGRVFEQVLRKRNYLIVRGYGEMVDLLAREGNIAGAEEVEMLWNELASKYDYSLLCGYSLDNFFHEAGPANARRVCHHHSRVLPIEAQQRANA